MRTVDAAGLPIGDDQPTRVMGVVNVSRRSPFEPSVYDEPTEAAAWVDDELIREGADIVDVGLASANKRFDTLTVAEELDRLDVACEAIASVSGEAVFSVETRYHEVAESALSRGFDMVNDVCGFADPAMPTVCEEFDATVVKMASPPDLTRPGAVRDVDWATEGAVPGEHRPEYVDAVYRALAQNGFTDRTILDPAFGGWSESKTLRDDRETFRRLREFRGYGRPILVSINRKNFLRTLAGRSTEAALPVSLAATAMAVERGVHVVRTHDVQETVDACRVGDAFAADRLHRPDIGVEELAVTTPSEAARHFDRINAVGDPDETVVRSFELTGLQESARDTLAAVVRGTGATVVAPDDPACPPDGGQVILHGTLGALNRVAGELEDHADNHLRQVVAAISESVGG